MTSSDLAHTPLSIAAVERLAWAIERDGLVDHHHVVAEVAARAADAGISPVLVGVLADPAEPEVARIRAFGIVALALARHLEHTPTRPTPCIAA